MPVPGEVEGIHPPEFLIDEYVGDAERSALEEFQVVIQTKPETAQGALDLCFDAPEAVKRILKFMHTHPEEGLRILGLVNVIVDQRLDIDVAFDPDTEAAIEADDAYKVAVDKFRRTKSEEDRTWFRRRRFGIAIRRALEAA